MTPAKRSTAKKTAKRAAPSAAPAPSVAAGQRSAAHALAHAARIQRVLKAKPKHKSRKQLEAALAEYQQFWNGLAPEVRQAAARELDGVHDMTPAAVSAAVSTLEG